MAHNTPGSKVEMIDHWYDEQDRIIIPAGTRGTIERIYGPFRRSAFVRFDNGETADLRIGDTRPVRPIEVHHYADGATVWARRSHGAPGRRVPRGTFGVVMSTRADGRLVIEWDNGMTTARPPADVSDRAEVNPATATQLEDILGTLTPGLIEHHEPEGEYVRGWHDCLASVREALVYDGLITEDDPAPSGT